MEGKKSIGTKLLIILVILLILVVAVMGYFLYQNFNKINEKDNKIAEINDRLSKIENSKIENSKNDTQEENPTSSKFKLGTYEMQEDRNIYDPDLSDYGVNIRFLGNNKFEATMDDGGLIEGTYNVSDNNIRCTFKEFTAETGPSQDIKGFISFEIIKDDTIKVKSASESIDIYLVDFVEKTLTDEKKDLSMEPYIEGMTFKLDK